MIEMTLYGRGGQGGVTLAKLVATAYFLRGKDAQAFGVYAAERSGAPIQAYIRIDDVEITNHNQIREPDHVIVVDPTLVEAIDITEGLKDGGVIIINSEKEAASFKFPARFKVATVNATGIAVKHKLGTMASPIVNTAIVGAVIKILGLTRLDSLLQAIKEGIPTKPEDNMAAAEEAYGAAQRVV